MKHHQRRGQRLGEPDADAGAHRRHVRGRPGAGLLYDRDGTKRFEHARAYVEVVEDVQRFSLRLFARPPARSCTITLAPGRPYYEDSADGDDAIPDRDAVRSGP
jgi:hypothetical protein